MGALAGSFSAYPWGQVGSHCHVSRTSLTLAIYARQMNRPDGEPERLKALVEGRELAALGSSREKRPRFPALIGLPVLFGGGVLAGVFVPFGLWLIVFIVLFAASLIAAFAAYERRDDGYLGPSELRAIEQRPGGQA